MALASRLAPTSMGGMHTNLPVPSTLKINKMILSLGPHRCKDIIWLDVKITTAPEIPTDGANCKDIIWFPSPNDR